MNTPNPYYAWLESLKVGDEVAISFRSTCDFDKVDRVTNTQIVVGHRKFRKKNGYQIGLDAWTIIKLEQPTEELKTRERVRVTRQKALSQFIDLSRMANTYTTDQLLACITVMERGKVAKE